MSATARESTQRVLIDVSFLTFDVCVKKRETTVKVTRYLLQAYIL